MNARCVFIGHDFKRVGKTVPIKDRSEWADNQYIGHFAMGECRRCGKLELCEVTGGLGRSWSSSEMITKPEYAEAFAQGGLREDLDEG